MISIVIVNWNSGALLERCVHSLEEFAPDCEIVVVDNASQDDSLDFLEHRKLSRTILLRNSSNDGFAAACNRGWREGQGDPILFLNPDTECSPEAVDKLAYVLAGHPEAWAIAGRLLDRVGKDQAGFNLRGFPGIGSVAAEMLLLDEMWPGNPWTRRYRMTDKNAETSGYVDQPAAACLMVRRESLVALGGFDEDFHPAWFEDVDLCRRIHNSGGRILYEPQSRFLHHGGVSLGSLTAEEFLRSYHRNQIRYFEKHHGKAVAARVRRLVVTGLYLRALLAGLGCARRSGNPVPSARSYRQIAGFLRRFPEGGP